MAKSSKPTPKPTPRPAPPAATTPPSKLTAAPPRRTFDWLGIAYPVLLLIIGFSLCRYVFDTKEALIGDNTEYYILGKALATGEGYVNISSVDKTPHHHFPPGYPLLIAGVMKVFSDNINTVKALNSFFLLLSVLLLFREFRRLSGNVHLSFVGCLLLLLNATMLEYATIEMSEMSFLAFSLLALVLFEKIDFAKPAFRDPWLYAFIATLAFSYHIRNVALALLAATGLVLLYRRRWVHLAMTVVGFGLLCLPWYLRNRGLGGDARVSQLSQINPLRPELGQLQGIGAWVSRFFENTERYLTREIPSSVLSFMQVDYQAAITPMEWIAGLGLLVLMGYGLWRLHADRLLLAGYVVATLGILLIYPPVWTGVRLVFHLIPFFVFLALFGFYESLKYLLAWVNVRNALAVNTLLPLTLLGFVFLFTPVVKQKHLYAKFGEYDASYKNYIETARWARENTPPGSVISVRKTSLFYLFADRFVSGYAFTADQKAFLDDLRRHKVNYVVLDALGFSSTGRYLYPVVVSNPDKFEVVLHLTEPDTYLLRFRDELGYSGEYKNGQPAGKGEYRFADGRRLSGTWAKARLDSLTGQGVLTDSAGKLIQQGRWQNGQFVGNANDQ
ncbi:MAG: hypothetical protein LH606_03035 [Cytophagaceae bacterium]|nr:hypothetical protein [Cytophagaceae bacterium]